jgi:hypothetical protein
VGGKSEIWLEDHDERQGEARCDSICYSSFYALGFSGLFAVAANVIVVLGL